MIILAVDDKQINNKVIELDIEEYMDRKNFSEYTFMEVGSGEEAIKATKQFHPTIIFLDIMMPNISGLDVLKILRADEELIQPKIIMVTALNDEKIREEAKELGADDYIAKPFDNKEIFATLDKFINLADVPEDDDFLDFDEEDDFFDFDEEDDEEDDSIGIQKHMMDDFNKSHKKVPAEEFLKDYEVLDYMIDELDDIEEDVYEHIDTLYSENLQESIESIIFTISEYSHFLNTFLEFQELSTSLNLLSRILEKSDFTHTDERKRTLIAEFIKSMLNDLVKWKNHVFVDKDAQDVFYLNASLLNSCIQLEDILKDI
ncbi:MAG: response regulator [Campylobacterota bacterium]|nr:response regulator [Campylobacterota bacterium]